MENEVKKLVKIKQRIVQSEERGIFHNSRQDVRELSKMVNALIDKINELVDQHNLLIQKTKIQ
jgi:hypothetical protein